MAANTVVIIKDGILQPLPDGDSIQDAGGNAITGTGISNIVEDTTPQLGGDLDVNSNGIDFGTVTVTDCLDEDDMASNSDVKICTQQSIKAYVDSRAAAWDAMVFKGTVGSGGTHEIAAFNSLATYSVGWTYKVITAGTIKGVVCEVGDMIQAIVDRAGSGEQDADWVVTQTNIDGAVVGPSTATDNAIARYNLTTGKLIQNSSTTLDDNGTINIPTGQTVTINSVDIKTIAHKFLTFTQNVYLDGQNALTGANVMDITTPYAGYIVASSIKMKSARTAGSVAVEPHKNGTGLTPTGLDLTIDDNPTTKANAAVSYGTADYDVAAGDTVGFLLTSASFTPLANVATLTLVIETAS